MLRHFFILDEITKRENIKVSEADIEARIARMAADRSQDPRTLRQELEKHEALPQLRHDLLDERTRTFLREHAEITEDEDL